ncbi:MAG: aminoacyl-tRNA hydrolase [Haloplasmataceae bacterium]|jgi:PTH1 family peptidyl-tRNA hydrolase|nr:aminoacyl-tRNA hydrolase [Haloplasmataceae bacterium]
MKLIVGLGNPGKEYENTRHNIGFIMIDEYANSEKVIFTKSKFKGELTKIIIGNEQVLLLKPTTYMNLSGEAVLAVKQFYDIKTENILIIYDDLDLPAGKIRLKQKGSAGGHKGIKSIISCLNSENFHRLKVGIDRDERIPVVDYVLGRFTKEQWKNIIDATSISLNAIDEWIKNDINYVMNKYN